MRALLVGGAHRKANADGSADVAHYPTSIFDTVHQALLEPSSIVLQIHGFASTRHPNYPEVVIGQYGSGGNELAQQIAKALNDTGVSAGVCSGNKWKALCGETTTQSSSTKEGIFIHIELDEATRANPEALMDGLQAALNP